jgi:hypothetical protein
MEKTVRFFSNLEEADQADARADSGLTPEQRLEIVMTLRDTMHPDAPQQGLVRVCRIVELELE